MFKPLQRWKRLESRIVVDDPWMRLSAHRCELPSGQVLDPYFVIEKEDWVHVYARDAEGRVLVVRQYRYPADAFCTELPGGVIDAGESPLVAARRELLEETGYTAEHWTEAGWMFANPGRQTNRLHVFMATGLQQAQGQSLDASEDIAFGFMSPAEVEAAIEAGEFSQGLHIASYYRCRNRATSA